MVYNKIWGEMLPNPPKRDDRASFEEGGLWEMGGGGGGGVSQFQQRIRDPSYFSSPTISYF
jgi:hypothetical protein